MFDILFLLWSPKGTVETLGFQLLQGFNFYKLTTFIAEHPPAQLPTGRPYSFGLPSSRLLPLISQTLFLFIFVASSDTVEPLGFQLLQGRSRGVRALLHT